MPDAFSKLVEAGWFKGWPEECAQQAKKHFSSFVDDEGYAYMKHCEDHPGLRMLSVFGDAECIYDNDSYTTLLKDFAAGSHGLLNITEIKEKWVKVDGEYESIRLACTVNDAKFKTTLDYESDWIADEFYDFLEEILTQLYPGVVLYCPHDLFGQDFGYLYIHKDCLAANAAHRLLPPTQEEQKSEEVDWENMDPDEIRDREYSYYLAWLLYKFDEPRIFPKIYHHDLDYIREYVEGGGNLELVSNELSSSLIEHVFHACHLSHYEDFSDYERIFDYLYSAGANLERDPEQGFVSLVLTEEPDNLFYKKLLNMGYKPSKASLDWVIEQFLEDGQQEDAERVRKDFGG